MTEALILIDLQNDYLADGELERCHDDLVATTNRLVAAAQRAGVPVVDVRTEHDPGGSTWTLSMQEDGVGPAMAGTEGAAPVAGLDSAGAEVVLKTRDSAFFGTALDRFLADRDVDRIVLAGVSTESCIAATADDAFAHDLRVTIVSDGTASIEPGLHQATLERLEAQRRQDLETADTVVRRWGS